MPYDVLLTDVGDDDVSVALAVMNTIQQLTPLNVLDVNDAREWLAHLPLLLRRGISEIEAHGLRRRYERLGATVTLLTTQLYFPPDIAGITRWRNEWFSEHLRALHEIPMQEWAQTSTLNEGYRFSYLPARGVDTCIRFWETDYGRHAGARHSIGRIGPMPGPPAREIHWEPAPDDWAQIQTAMADYHFWESESWDTVPDEYVILNGVHWIIEGWRAGTYHVLVDQTPNEGAAREVGLLLFALLPDDFPVPKID